eukprot:13270774-Ditylum_brightwellii.AAC.1
MSLPPFSEGLAAAHRLLALNPKLWILCQNSETPNPTSHAQDWTEQQILTSLPVGDDIIPITSKGGIIHPLYIRRIELR